MITLEIEGLYGDKYKISLHDRDYMMQILGSPDGNRRDVAPYQRVREAVRLSKKVGRNVDKGEIVLVSVRPRSRLWDGSVKDVLTTYEDAKQMRDDFRKKLSLGGP